MYPSHRKLRIFTLLELLIVVAIIAILVAMLLPALGKARQMAFQAQCISKLKQLSTASQMYMNDNKEYFTAFRDINGKYWHKKNLLMSYAFPAFDSDMRSYDPYKVTNYLHCPADPNRKGVTAVGATSAEAFSYGYNELTGNSTYSTLAQFGHKKASQLKFPSIGIMMADINSDLINSSSGPSNNYAGLCLPSGFAALFRDPIPYPPYLSDRHGNRVNVAHFDGSAVSLSWSMMKSISTDDIKSKPYHGF